MDGAMRGSARSAVRTAEELRIGIQSGGNRRHPGESSGPEPAACAQGPRVAVCRRSRSSGGGVRLHGDARAGGAGEVSEKLSWAFTGRRLRGLRRFVRQSGTRFDRSGLLGPLSRVRRYPERKRERPRGTVLNRLPGSGSFLKRFFLEPVQE